MSLKTDELKSRKSIRLKGADYSKAGAYFITICPQDRRCILSQIVGTGVLDGPKFQSQLTGLGMIADKYINQLNDFYDYISVENYVIMPNHIHLLLLINPSTKGPSGTPVPTTPNSIISKFVSTFKRFCNRDYRKNIWQYRSYDHIIITPEDYEMHIKYIYENPIRWYYDELYSEE